MTASCSQASEDQNQVYDNLDHVEKAIKKGQCLFSVSGKDFYPMHNFYRWVWVEIRETGEQLSYKRKFSEKLQQKKTFSKLKKKFFN